MVEIYRRHFKKMLIYIHARAACISSLHRNDKNVCAILMLVLAMRLKRYDLKNVLRNGKPERHMKTTNIFTVRLKVMITNVSIVIFFLDN